MAARPSLKDKIRALKVFPEPWGCIPDPSRRNPEVKNFSATFRTLMDRSRPLFGEAPAHKSFRNLTERVFEKFLCEK
jgi:hypothetical protein